MATVHLRDTLEKFFLKNSIPTESNFHDLIASMVHKNDNSFGPLSFINGLIRQEDWQNANLNSNWHSAGFEGDDATNPAGYFKDTQGIVHLRGVVLYSGAESPPITIFSFRQGEERYLPQHREFHAGTAEDGKEFAGIEITSGGEVRLLSGPTQNVSLDGITYRAKPLD